MNLISLPAICRGDEVTLQQWLRLPFASMLKFSLPCIVIGLMAYGASMGAWRGPTMALFVALKLPLVIIFTLILNAWINTVFAIVLGSGFSVKQTFQYLLTGFSLMAIILGALSPLALFMAMNAPNSDQAGAEQFHSFFLLIHVVLISYAGATSHLILLHYVRAAAMTTASGTSTIVSWLAGNLLVGAQVSWILRPFFGSPNLDVSFIREHPMNGTFYESVLRSLINLII